MLSNEDTMVRDLLYYDLQKFAKRTQLFNSEIHPFKTTDAVKLLNLAERYSRDPSDEKKEICLLICGLLWEHKRDEWNNIEEFLMTLFSRLGLGPSTKMFSSYNPIEDNYDEMYSIINELETTARLMDYEVNIKESTLLLSKFQKDLWVAIDSHSRIGISAPTSAGKSYALVHKIIDLFQENFRKIIYIVPTISLVNQVTSDLNNTLKEYNMLNIDVYQSFNNEHLPENVIFVFTQERAQSAYSINPEYFKDTDVLIVDEVQNIERVSQGNNERAQIMYDFILEFDLEVNPSKIVVSGPRLKNIKNITVELFGVEGISVSSELPPVVNLTYSIVKKEGEYYLRQYSQFLDDPQTIKISSNNSFSFIGKQRYNDDLYEFLSSLSTKLNEEYSGTLIFSPTSNQSIKTAKGMANHFSKRGKDKQLDSLISYIEDTVHPNYSLANTLKKGLGYHNGKMPMHIRVAVEDAFSNLVVNTLACTTTLLQGVNFPAKNIITRNPNLFTRKSKGKENATLTGYEFANLRGRAGRLMKDFIGRAIVLDESYFETNQIKLFEYPEKEVQTGYGKRFQQNKKDVLSRLKNNEVPKENTKNNDLNVHIRQTIIKHDQRAYQLLRDRGLHINSNDFNAIRSNLDNLAIPKEYCVNNPYWDPLVLNNIYENLDLIPSPPESVFDRKYVSKLFKTISTLKFMVPYYYGKYISINGKGWDKRLTSICIMARDWSAEESLRTIITWDGSQDSEEFDDRIDTINTTIMYGIPKLLKPIIMMKNPNSSLLSVMEMGAYNYTTRRLIELGLARETSLRIIKLAHKLQLIKSTKDRFNDSEINQLLKDIMIHLNFWEKNQISKLIK